jgi:hypothetical protein
VLKAAPRKTLLMAGSAGAVEPTMMNVRHLHQPLRM